MNYLQNLTIFASEAAGEKAGLFEALGIDWKLLILQSAAFLVLVVLLAKFVYPVMIKAIDKRQEQLDAGAKASEEAQQRAIEAEEAVEKHLKAARKQAEEIVATAHKEATDMVAQAEKRATTKAEHIVNEARANLENDIAAAKTELKKETIELIALATEKVVQEKLDTKKDASLIEKALKETK